MTCVDLDRDVDAFVDGEIGGDAVAAIRDHLQTCGGCADRVRERRALIRLVQAAPYFAAPAHLRAAAARQASRAVLLRRILAAAAAVVLVAGASVSAIGLAARAGRRDAERAVDSHVRALAGNRLFEVRSTDQHTVKPWFGGKLDYSPPVADLAPIGFPLVGGRIDALGGQAVAALVYQRRQHVINVFVAPARPEWWPRAGAYTVRGFQVRHWTAHDMTFWAVSDLNPSELAEFTRALGG